MHTFAVKIKNQVYCTQYFPCPQLLEANNTNTVVVYIFCIELFGNWLLFFFNKSYIDKSSGNRLVYYCYFFHYIIFLCICNNDMRELQPLDLTMYWVVIRTGYCIFSLSITFLFNVCIFINYKLHYIFVSSCPDYDFKNVSLNYY